MHKTSIIKIFRPAAVAGYGLVQSKRTEDHDGNGSSKESFTPDTLARLKEREKDECFRTCDSSFENITTWLAGIDWQNAGSHWTFDGSARDNGGPTAAAASSAHSFADRGLRPLPTPLQPRYDQSSLSSHKFLSNPSEPGTQRISNTRESAPSGDLLARSLRRDIYPLEYDLDDSSLHSFVIGNLNLHITSSKLHKMFQSLTHVLPSFVSAAVVYHPFTGESLGYAKVFLRDENDKHWAVANLQGLNCGGQPMHIYPATYQALSSDSVSLDAASSNGLRMLSTITPLGNKWITPKPRSSSSSVKTKSSLASRSSKVPRDFHEINWTAELKKTGVASESPSGGAVSRIGKKMSSSDNRHGHACPSLLNSSRDARSSARGSSLDKDIVPRHMPITSAATISPDQTLSQSPKIHAKKVFRFGSFRIRWPLWRKGSRKKYSQRSSSDTQTDIFRRRITIPGEEVEDRNVTAIDVDVFALPEHLPSSPICPANPHHRGSSFACQYHGLRKRASI